MVSLTTQNSKDGLEAQKLLVVLDRNVVILEQDLEGGEDVLGKRKVIIRLLVIRPQPFLRLKNGTSLSRDK